MRMGPTIEITTAMSMIFSSLLGCSGQQAAKQSPTTVSALNQVKVVGDGQELFRRQTADEDTKIAKLVIISVVSLKESSILLQCQEFTKSTNSRDAAGENWRLTEEF